MILLAYITDESYNEQKHWVPQLGGTWNLEIEKIQNLAVNISSTPHLPFQMDQPYAFKSTIPVLHSPKLSLICAVFPLTSYLKHVLLHLCSHIHHNSPSGAVKLQSF